MSTSSSTVVALPAFASLLPLLLFDEKIRTASLFSARLASYREKLLVRCNVVTSSSPPAQRSNLKARRRRGEAIALVARCDATAEFQCDDAESIRCTRLDFRLSVTYLSFRRVKGLVLLEYRARPLNSTLPFYVENVTLLIYYTWKLKTKL